MFIEPRQHDGHTGMSAAPAMLYKPVRVENLPSTDARPGVKKIRLTYGPLELKPASFKRAAAKGKMDPNSDQFSGMVTGVPTNIMVLRTNSSLTYENGSIADVVNGVYNHHLIIADTAKIGPSPIKCAVPDPKSSATPNMGLLMGASEANRDLQFAAGGDVVSGFLIGKDDKIMLNGEIVNYTNDTKLIYSVSDVEYVEAAPKDALDATMNIFDITMCSSGNSLEAPHGQMKWSVSSKKVQIVKDGTILYRRGHMHDGGDSVTFNLNGKQICESTAIYGGESATMVIDGKQWQTISEMKSCNSPVKVKAGDILEISANFDLEKHPA